MFSCLEDLRFLSEYTQKKIDQKCGDDICAHRRSSRVEGPFLPFLEDQSNCALEKQTDITPGFLAIIRHVEPVQM